MAYHYHAIVTFVIAARTAGVAAGGCGFGDLGGVCACGNRRLQRGNVIRGRGGSRGTRRAQQILIKGEDRIAAQIEHAAVGQLHLYHGIRVGLDDLFGVNLVAHAGCAHNAIDAGDAHVAEHDFDRTDFCCLGGGGSGCHLVISLNCGYAVTLGTPGARERLAIAAF